MTYLDKTGTNRENEKLSKNNSYVFFMKPKDKSQNINYQPEKRKQRKSL